jgi:hypothetical protein
MCTKRGNKCMYHANKKHIETDPSNADHPARKAAIHIIEEVIEPLIKKSLKGYPYYDAEDKITDIICHNMKST